MNYLFNNRYNLHYELDKTGTAWFYADELARHLGYPDAYHICRMCKDDEIRVLTINNPFVPELGLDMSKNMNLIGGYKETPTHGGCRRFTIVNEEGVTRIAMNIRATRPDVKCFKQWIISNLIPGARKIFDQLTLNFDNQELQSIQAVTFKQLAAIISQYVNYNVDEVTVKTILRQNKFLDSSIDKYNQPTEYSLNEDYMKYVYVPKEDRYEALVTNKGISFFINLITNDPFTVEATRPK